jgi:co-chaperonin GroES (HSP10)
MAELIVAKDVVVLERIMAKKMSDGGIVIPDNAQAQMNADKTAKVVEVGEDLKDAFFKVGDTVVVNPAYGTAVILGKRSLIFGKEQNVLAVVR